MGDILEALNNLGVYDFNFYDIRTGACMIEVPRSYIKDVEQVLESIRPVGVLFSYVPMSSYRRNNLAKHGIYPEIFEGGLHD